MTRTNWYVEVQGTGCIPPQPAAELLAEYAREALERGCLRSDADLEAWERLSETHPEDVEELAEACSLWIERVD